MSDSDDEAIRAAVDTVLLRFWSPSRFEDNFTIASRVSKLLGREITPAEIKDVLVAYEHQGKVRLAKPKMSSPTAAVTGISGTFLDQLRTQNAEDG